MDKSSLETLLDFYNMLLEAERAGVAVLSELVQQIDDHRLRPLLKKFLRDEGVNCRILSSLIHDLGTKPSNKIGVFADKVRQLDSMDEKVRLLIRGQAWVARKIQEFRYRLPAGSPYFFMEAIKIQHEENVEILKKLLFSPS